MQYVVGSKTVTLVNSRDQVTGEMDIFDAHRQPCYLHRASSVWLFRKNETEDGQERVHVLLQQRSPYKPIGAGWWGNAVCANVRPGETYQECAIRRLDGEIGVKSALLKPVFTFKYKAYGNQEFSEWELDQVLVGLYDGKIELNRKEVTQVRWVDWNQLLTALDDIAYISAEESLSLSYASLEEKAPPVRVEIAQESIAIAPWTVMMIRDHRLRNQVTTLFS